MGRRGELTCVRSGVSCYVCGGGVNCHVQLVVSAVLCVSKVCDL